MAPYRATPALPEVRWRHVVPEPAPTPHDVGLAAYSVALFVFVLFVLVDGLDDAPLALVVGLLPLAFVGAALHERRVYEIDEVRSGAIRVRVRLAAWAGPARAVADAADVAEVVVRQHVLRRGGGSRYDLALGLDGGGVVALTARHAARARLDEAAAAIRAHLELDGARPRRSDDPSVLSASRAGRGSR